MCAGAVPLILNGRTTVLLASFPVGKTPVTQRNAGATTETLLPTPPRSPAGVSWLRPPEDDGLQGPGRGVLLGSDEFPCSQGEKTIT